MTKVLPADTDGAQTSLVLEPAAVPAAMSEHARLIETAIREKVPVEQLERLLAMRSQLKSEHAREQFNAAKKRFQSLCPVIDKPAEADAGKYSYRYTPFDHLARVIRPHLDVCGFTYSFDSEMVSVADKSMAQRVVCRLSHEDGHEEQYSFTAMVDISAKMTTTQKGASALSYGKRYSLLNALGIATSDDVDATDLRAEHENPAKGKAPVAQPRDGRPTKTAVNNIKRRWAADRDVTDKESALQEFKEWVYRICERVFTVDDPNHWTADDLDKCDLTLQEQGK